MAQPSVVTDDPEAYRLSSQLSNIGLLEGVPKDVRPVRRT